MPVPARPAFSLLGVVIALGIFASGLLAIAALTPPGQVSVRRARTASAAAGIAERELAGIRNAWGQSGSEPPEMLSGTDPAGYRWSAVIERGEICTVVLTVSWEEEGVEKSEIFKTRFVPH